MPVTLPFFYATDHLPATASSAAIGDGGLDAAAVANNATLGRVVIGTGGYQATFSPVLSIAMGCRIFPGANVNYELVSFRNSSGIMLRVITGSSQVMSVVRGSTTLATFTMPNQFWFMEVYVAFHSSDGAVIVRLDGTEVVNLTGINTSNVAIGTGCSIVSRASSASTLSTDLYVREAPAEGSPFFGPILLRYLAPESDVQEQWTPNSGTDNYSRVNQVHDGDTTYVSTDTLNNEDIYTLADLPAGVNSVIAVVPVAVSTAPSGGAPQINLGLETTAGVVQTGDRTVGVSGYQTQVGAAQTEKPGGGGWSVAAVNELKLRLKAV